MLTDLEDRALAACDDQHLDALTARAILESVTGEATLHLDPHDPFCWGIRA